MNNFFWQGMLHPVWVPEHLLVLVALGLLAGQQGGKHLRWALPCFMAALTVGIGLTKVLHAPWNTGMVLLIMAMILGILAALQLRLPVWLLAVASLIAGLVIGLDSVVSMIPGMRATKLYASMAGMWSGAALLMVFFSAAGFYLHKLWHGIGVRVLGAWVTAGAVMALTLLLSGALRTA